MMDFFLPAFPYVMGDMYFWPSMAFTTMIAIFVGAIVYDGIIEDVKKAVITLTSYIILLFIVNFTRISPLLKNVAPENRQMPFAGIVSLILVTAFYLLGLWLGVRIVKRVCDRKFLP